MSDEADLGVGAEVDARLATLFRELCRRELLDERQTEDLVGRAMSRLGAPPHAGRAPTPALGRAAMRRDPGARKPA
jgi:hypothetical protein